MKDPLGHGSNGRGGGKRLAKPIPGHPYHQKSDAELRYIAKDAGEAMKATEGMSSYNPNSGKREDTSGKYADQVNDAASVMAYRRAGGKQDLGPAAAQAMASGQKSMPVPAHGGMSSAPGSVPYNDQRVGSREHDAFGRPRTDTSEYDEYSRDLALRSRNGGIGSGGRR